MDNPRATRPHIDETAAENQDRALAVVQQLLKERGVRARCHHTINLRLLASRVEETNWPDRPVLRSWLERYPPELEVIGPQGWREATVTMGPRSGFYLVSLRAGPGLQKVGREHPEKVADLITRTAAKAAEASAHAEEERGAVNGPRRTERAS